MTNGDWFGIFLATKRVFNTINNRNYCRICVTAFCDETYRGVRQVTCFCIRDRGMSLYKRWRRMRIVWLQFPRITPHPAVASRLLVLRRLRKACHVLWYLEPAKTLQQDIGGNEFRKNVIHYSAVQFPWPFNFGIGLHIFSLQMFLLLLLQMLDLAHENNL